MSAQGSPRGWSGDEPMDCIVLAYSGRLEATAAIPWLAETYGVGVVSLTLDLGQGRDLMQIRDRAWTAGAIRAHVLDVRSQFAREFILPALQAGALYEDRRPMGTALARALVAQKLVEIAALEQARAIAYGSSDPTRDPPGLEMAARALNPDIRVIVPARSWNMTPADAIVYAGARGIRVPPAAEGLHRIDETLWGRSISGSTLDEFWADPPDDLYVLTKSPADAPEMPALVEIEFDRGVPVSVNGVAMPLVDLITSLETIAGAHGVGRIDLVENGQAGTKSRTVHEAPAAVVLHAAHHDLESFVTSRDLAAPEASAFFDLRGSHSRRRLVLADA